MFGGGEINKAFNKIVSRVRGLAVNVQRSKPHFEKKTRRGFKGGQQDTSRPNGVGEPGFIDLATGELSDRRHIKDPSAGRKVSDHV